MPRKHDEAVDRRRMEILQTASTRAQAAEWMGVAPDTVDKIRSRLETRYKVKLPVYGKGGGKLLTNDSPFSDRGTYHEDWDKQRCIEELRKIIFRYPDKVISRNFFHVVTGIAESTWNRYVGTFEEFKRQAGVMLSRQAHQLEKQVAKHTSVDQYRAMNEARRDWGDVYARPSGRRFQTGIIGVDFHDQTVDPFLLEVFISTIQRVQPEWVNFGGDLFDLPEFGNYRVDPRDWDVVGRIKFVHERILQRVREVAPNAQIDVIEGNHEYRLLRHLADATPALKVVLSDLHGMNISRLLGLDRYEVNYIAQGDLATFRAKDILKECSKNYKIYDRSFMVHHFPWGKRYALPGVNGHEHKHVVTPLHSALLGSYEWHQLGCGHVRAATYCDGDIWQNGFAIVHLDTHKQLVNIEYVPVTDYACVGGRYYHREEEV